jgi:hypothetical protein
LPVWTARMERKRQGKARMCQYSKFSKAEITA